MQKFRFITPLLFLVLSTPFLNAQQKVNISGLIVDKDNGAAMQFVNVVVLNTADSSIVVGSLSDEAGAFR